MHGVVPLLTTSTSQRAARKAVKSRKTLLQPPLKPLLPVLPEPSLVLLLLQVRSATLLSSEHVHGA